LIGLVDGSIQNVQHAAQNPYDAWCVPDSQGSDVGSYAPNGWMCNPPRSMSSLWGRRPVVIEAPTAEDTNATL